MTRKHLSRERLKASHRPPDTHKPESSELRMVTAPRAAAGSVASKHYSALASHSWSAEFRSGHSDRYGQTGASSAKDQANNDWGSDIQRKAERAGMLSLEKV